MNRLKWHPIEFDMERRWKDSYRQATLHSFTLCKLYSIFNFEIVEVSDIEELSNENILHGTRTYLKVTRIIFYER